MSKRPPPGDRTVATNRRARHNFDIQETFEAGIVLSGPEVKSLREGRATLADAFGRIRDGEIWMEGLHIPPYEPAPVQGYQPTRPRKLLVHRDQIDRLASKTAEQGLTLIPLKVYFTRGLAKVEVGLGRGRRKYEKRQSIAEREHRREMERAMGTRRREG
jgi:SsrA-binding protein